MSGKRNNRHRQCTQLDVERAKKQAQTEAVRYVWAIVLYTLKDKHDASEDDIIQFWVELQDVSDSISKGYLNLTDIRHVLKTEYNIVL